MRTSVLGRFAIPLTDRGEVIAEFTAYLRALFPVIVVKVLVRLFCLVQVVGKGKLYYRMMLYL